MTDMHILEHDTLLDLTALSKTFAFLYDEVNAFEIAEWFIFTPNGLLVGILLDVNRYLWKSGLPLSAVMKGLYNLIKVFTCS